MVSYLEDVISKVVVYLNYSRRKTVNESMVSAALADMGGPTGWLDQDHKYTNCKLKTPKSGKRRSRPGRAALSNVRYYQKQHGCVLIPKSQFAKLSKSILCERDGPRDIPIRWNGTAMELLQYATESHIVNLLQSAGRTANIYGRSSLYPKDIQVMKKACDQ
jgi:histone H3/H4